MSIFRLSRQEFLRSYSNEFLNRVGQQVCSDVVAECQTRRRSLNLVTAFKIIGHLCNPAALSLGIEIPVCFWYY